MLSQLAFSLQYPLFDQAIFLLYQIATYVMNCKWIITSVIICLSFVEAHIAQVGHCFQF